MNKTDIIYHEVKPRIGCPDGLAAAWVCKRKYPDAILIGRCHAGETRSLPNFVSGDLVIIVDFSFPEKFFLSLSERGIKFQLIDHHKTAKDNLQRLLEGGDLYNSVCRTKECFVEIDTSECGATLAWEIFNDEPVPEFLKHIKDRDLWNFQLERTSELHEAMRTIGRSFLLFDTLYADNNGEFLNGLKRVGEKLLKPRRELIASIADRCEFNTVAGYKNIPFVKVTEEEEKYVSDICEMLYKKYPEALFSACLCSTSWSLRSNKHGNNTDVGSIAKKHGGGGHRNAEGFPLSQ